MAAICVESRNRRHDGAHLSERLAQPAAQKRW